MPEQGGGFVRPFLFYLTAALIVACDQISKWAVLTKLSQISARPVIGSFLWINYTENTGGAFSILRTNNNVFIVIAIIAGGALIYAYHRSSRADLLVSGALALALGGAVGNLIDRIRLHHVIDFFDLRYHGNNIWPIFNVADSAITVGIILLAWNFIIRREPAAKEERVPEEMAASPTAEQIST